MPAASTLGRLVRLAPLGLRLTLARPALRTATVFSLNAIRTKATAATEAAPKTKKAVATPAATTATTKAKATEAAPKKATPKKAVAVKATVKKAAPKKKVVKKAAPKKVVKKVKKPVLTPEQKALRREKASAKRAKEAVKRADNKAKLEIKAKKVASLDAPTGAQGRVNPWTQFFTEQTKGTSGFKPLSSEMLAAYKNLSADEKAGLLERCAQRVQKNREEHRAFIESCSIEEIHKANLARKWLKSHNVAGWTKLRPLKDPRVGKRPSSSYILFATEHKDDFKQESIADRARAAGEAWNQLPEQEKKHYQDIYQQQLGIWKQKNASV